MDSELSKLCIGPTNSIRQAIACMDDSRVYIALVADAEGYLLDTITDGDVRRAILAGVDLDAPVTDLRDRRKTSPYPEPVTAPEGTSPEVMVRLMRERGVPHLPLLDEAGRLARLVTLADLVESDGLPLRAVIMAGGYGTRLRPLTNDLPKPMLPVGEKPLLEHIVGQLRAAGIKSVSLTTHYKSDLIASHFKDGRDFGVDISYVMEEEPLGTAGALGLLEHVEGPLLVINGDILTRMDFGAMLIFHQEHGADMTIGVRELETVVPFGVVETEGDDVVRIAEKPVVNHLISAGVYLLNPDVLGSIPAGGPYDMPELVNDLIGDGRRVVGFPIREYWLDIGRIDDYRKAQEEIEISNEDPRSDG